MSDELNKNVPEKESENPQTPEVKNPETTAEPVEEKKEETSQVAEVKEEKTEEATSEEVKNEFLKPVKARHISSVSEEMENYNKKVDAFNVEYKQSRRVNIILLIVVAIIFIGSVALSSVIGQAYIFILIGGVVLYFVLTTVFSKKNQKKITAKANEILNDYFSFTDSYAYDDEAFSDVVFDYNVKLDPSYLLSLDIFKDVDSVAGRDLVKGKLLGIDFLAGDGSIKTKEVNEKGKNILAIVFYGKAVFLEKSYINEGRLVVYLKGKGNDAPTNVEGLEVVNTPLSERFVVYSEKGNEKILTKKVCEKIEKMEINDNLYDFFIVFNNQRTIFLFSYSDEMMVISVDHHLEEKLVEQYPSDARKMVEIVKALEAK